MELWDIYDENKERTGRTMKHNDWNMKPGGIPPDGSWSFNETGWKISDHPKKNG